MNSADKTRFDTLDAMRGVAALMVIPRHTELLGTSWANSHSYLAVDLFFMLSGFVIANAYERHLQAQTLSPGKFILLRLVRFYPLLVLGVLLGVLASLTAPLVGSIADSSLRDGNGTVSAILISAALSLAFLPSKLGESTLLFPLNTPIWSLMFEMAINVAFALTLGWWTTRRLWLLVLGSGLLMAVMGLRITSIDLGWAWSFKSIMGGTIRTVFGFATGVLLFRLFAQRSAAPPKVGGMVALCLAVMPLMVPGYEIANGLIDVVATLFVFPLAIWLGAHARLQGNKVLIFSVLGTLSYPIYVLHVPILRLFEQLLLHPVSGQILTAAHLTVPILAMLLLGTAWILNGYYDQPLRNWLQDKWRLRSRRPAATEPLRQPVPAAVDRAASDAVASADLEAVNRLLTAEEALAISGAGIGVLEVVSDKPAPTAASSVAP